MSFDSTEEVLLIDAFYRLQSSISPVKKQNTKPRSITAANVDGFSKFFH